MLGSIYSFITLLCYGIFIIIPSSKKYIPYVGLSFYYIIIYQLFAPLFGISLILLLQFFYLSYFILISINKKQFRKIIKIFKHKEIKILFVYVIFIFLNHYFVGSSYRHNVFTFSFRPIVHLILLCISIQFAIIQNHSFERVISFLRVFSWVNIILGGYLLVFTNIDYHTNIEFSENIGFNSNVFGILCIQLLTIELLFLRNISLSNIPLLLIPIYLAILTGSRAAILALLALILYWVFLSKNKRLVFLISLISITLITTFNFDSIYYRFLSIFDIFNESGLRGLHRYLLIARGINMFLENPLFGTGVGTFHQYRHTWVELIHISRPDSFVDSHNLYVQILSEMGLLGAILFILLMYYLAKSINRYKIYNKTIYHYLMSNIILFLFSGLFVHDFYRYYLLLPIIVGCIYSKEQDQFNFIKKYSNS